MKPVTAATFDRWLAAYSRASVENDPQASSLLFAEDARYYEDPFAPPLIGRRAIYDYWAVGAVNLTDKRCAHEVLTVCGKLGVARWQSRFVVKATGATVALDCIFAAEFDDQGLCCCFREWWHSRRTDDPCEAPNDAHR
ncbi:MAG: nuclear transport factor 2 family protein [Caldilinea sp.]|nr:nuclear transport factor 2 family protein [Caldilinea sp.]